MKRIGRLLVLALCAVPAVWGVPSPAAAGEGGTCVGDIDGDARADVFDLLELVSSWGSCPGEPEACPADLSGEGVVEVRDLVILVQNFGPCEAPILGVLGNGDQEQVTICHIPPGDPDARHTIVVGEPAVQAHLAHGDELGTCD